MTIPGQTLSPLMPPRSGGSLGRAGQWGPRVVRPAGAIDAERPPDLLSLLLDQRDTVDISPEGLALAASRGSAVIWHDVPERFYTPSGAVAVSALAAPRAPMPVRVAADRADRVEISDAARRLLAARMSGASGAPVPRAD